MIKTIMMHNPTTLEQWYALAQQASNAESRTNILANLASAGGGKGSSSKTRDPDAMDVDAILIQALSKEEREKHVRDGLCFICHKGGHQSKQCYLRKNKGKGKKKFNGKGRKRPQPGHHIRAASKDEDDESQDEEEGSDLVENDNIKAIRALMT
jgi:hypothetical protein